MSVERCIPAAHKAHNGGQGVKGKAAGEASPLDAGGFSALLMQLGADEADVGAGLTDGLASAADGVAPELLASTQEKPEVDGAKVDASLLAAQPAQLQQSPPVDHSLLLAQSMQFQQSPSVEQGLPLAQPKQGLQSIGQLAELTPAAGALATGALAATVPLETELQPALREGQTLTPGAAPASPQAPKWGDGVRSELGEALKEAGAKAPAPQRSVSRAAVAEVASMQLGSANANANLVAEARTHKVAQGEARTELNSGLTQALVASGVGESGVRRAERTGEKMASGQGGNGEGAWSAQAPLNAEGVEQSFTLSEPTAAMSPEAMVAEQVNYWIGHDVQNAELKLDGMGDSPVEVSISLQGNEARVDFRTDQLEARQVLEGAVSHLKDLLGNEGLVLSGVSVGSSGAGGSASQERKPHQNGRQATVAVSSPQAVDASVRPARPSGRSVDLFV